MWRLDTADGRWAVKASFHRSSEDEVRLATAFQEAACAAGVPAPRVRRTTEGRVFATLEGRQVRVYEWVDLRAPDAMLDLDRGGAVVAAIHRTSAAEAGPLDRAGSAAWIGEVLDEPHTRQRLDAILDAAGSSWKRAGRYGQ